MNENENMAMYAENVEQTTEESVVQEGQSAEPEKVYTEADFNAKLDEVIGKKIARREAKIRKEYERKYGELESVLKAGTGKETVDDMTNTFRDFYQKKGIQMPTEPKYSDKDVAVLARVEAEDIIRSGFDDVVEELDRLTAIGFEHMTQREKAVYKTLAEYHQEAERGNALSKMGVKEDVYNSTEFRDFSAKFDSKTPITEVYEIYNKMQPRKEVHTIGSMKNTDSGDTGVKDFYTRDEALKFTKADFDKNPALYKAVQKSMQKW